MPSVEKRQLKCTRWRFWKVYKELGFIEEGGSKDPPFLFRFAVFKRKVFVENRLGPRKRFINDKAQCWEH